MARIRVRIPPGGFAAFGQQTPAVQALFSTAARPAVRRKKRTTKKRTTKKRPVRRRRATTARKKKPARMVKGSAAAKRHMAKLRKMRK